MPPVSQTGPEKAKQVSSSKINKTSVPSELLFSEEQNERVELGRMPEIPALGVRGKDIRGTLVDRKEVQSSTLRRTRLTLERSPSYPGKPCFSSTAAVEKHQLCTEYASGYRKLFV